MDNMFKRIWETQFNFNQKFYLSKIGKKMEEMTMEEKVYWSKNQLLSIVKEAMEVLDEIPNWKEHRITNASFIPSNLYEEIIDVNKFSMGMAQIWGMSMEEYYKEYLRKSWVVDQRWEQEHTLKCIDKNAKIVGIDIDGVLGDYPNHFFEYIYRITGTRFDSIERIKSELGTIRYEELKSDYRQSGFKALMPTKSFASELTYLLKDLGYTIILLTSRPYKDYYTIYPDTLKFLELNDIKFDAIIWDENKHLKIIKDFPNMEFMIEDTYDIVDSIAKEGYKVYYVVDCISKMVIDDDTKNIKPIYSLAEVINDLNI